MLGTILAKIARQQPLTEFEIRTLERDGNELESVSSLARTLFSSGTSNLGIRFPIEKIYGEKLPNNVSSISVKIPSDYQHLLIMGQTRGTGTGGGGYININFNGDTGSNYLNNTVLEIDGVSQGAHNLSASLIPIVSHPVDDGPANYAGSFVVFVPHYQSVFYKSVLMIDGSFSDVTHAELTHGVWKNTSPINLIVFSPDLFELKEGSLVTVLGIR